MTTSPDFAEHRTDQTARCPATAQAVELVRALRHQLREMTAQLAWVESQDVTRMSGPSHARCAWKQAALRRDIREAQVLIDRLQRRYLSGEERTQQRPDPSRGTWRSRTTEAMSVLKTDRMGPSSYGQCHVRLESRA
jgi:hypothetical protein